MDLCPCNAVLCLAFSHIVPFSYWPSPIFVSIFFLHCSVLLNPFPFCMAFRPHFVWIFPPRNAGCRDAMLFSSGVVPFRAHFVWIFVPFLYRSLFRRLVPYILGIRICREVMPILYGTCSIFDCETGRSIPFGQGSVPKLYGSCSISVCRFFPNTNDLEPEMYGSRREDACNHGISRGSNTEEILYVGKKERFCVHTADMAEYKKKEPGTFLAPNSSY